MGGQIRKKRFQKHLRIGVRFDGSGFVLLNGNPLPELAKDSIAELVLAPECIQNAKLRASLTGQKSTPLLKEGSRVLCGVSSPMIEDIFVEGLNPSGPVPIHTPYKFVEVTLNADLWLQVRGDQEARLSPCPCKIPALNKDAESLNQAFTLISEEYETKRRSHSGNVFERVYAQDERGNWQSLDELRLSAVQKLIVGEK
jgi:hypothetical protein